MNLSAIFLLVAVVCFTIEAVRSRSVLAGGLAFFAGAFLVESGFLG